MTVFRMDVASGSTGDDADGWSVPSEFYKSLQEAGIDNILQFLAKKPDAELRLRLNEQRGDPELEVAQKLTLLRTKLENSPGPFLFQYGKYLSPSHLDCFKTIALQHEEVQLYLDQINASPGSRPKQVKNRRYEALKKLVETTDYFSEEEMQRRNPILFNQLIGRYHSKEEREAFLYQSNQSSSSRLEGPCRATPLTDMLIAHMNRNDGVCSNRRIDQEMQLQEEKQADQQYSVSVQNESGMEGTIDDDGEEEEEEMYEGEDHGIEMDESEKDLLKEEFFTTMYRHFLEGKDEDFPYETVDDNTDYDVGETFDQDQEDKYFAGEENGVENATSREETINVNSNNSADVQLNCDESEEDELDIYMKEIEVQVKLQSGL